LRIRIVALPKDCLGYKKIGNTPTVTELQYRPGSYRGFQIWVSLVTGLARKLSPHAVHQVEAGFKKTDA